MVQFQTESKSKHRRPMSQLKDNQRERKFSPLPQLVTVHLAWERDQVASEVKQMALGPGQVNRPSRVCNDLIQGILQPTSSTDCLSKFQRESQSSTNQPTRVSLYREFECAVVQSLSCVQLFWDPMDCSSPDSSVHGISQARILQLLPFPSPGDLPDPGIQPVSPAFQADCLLSEPPRKPKSTGLGNSQLLQGNFPTQESNQGLQHCRQIFYQLSYQGSPCLRIQIQKNIVNTDVKEHTANVFLYGFKAFI